jgi:hypothetical protein
MDNGVRYLIHRIGTPRLQVRRGGIAPAGEWWNNDGGWYDRHSADIFPSDAPDTLNLPIDGEWVAVFVEISAGFVS